MADQDKNEMAGTADGDGDRPATAEGAVSTGAGVASEAADAAGGGEAGRAADNGPSGRGEGPGGPGSAAADAAPAGQAGDGAASAGEAEPGREGLHPGLAQRPAGFAGGYLRRDPLAYPGGQGSDESPDRGRSGGGYEPGNGAAGSVWMPEESAEPGDQESPYASYGEYEGYPVPGQEQDYGTYGDPEGYGGYGAYGADQGYDPGRGYDVPEGYAQAYPPPAGYGEAAGYGSSAEYGEGQQYGEAGYPQDPAYGRDQSYAESQPYGQAQGYPPGPAYGQSYAAGTSYGEAPADGGERSGGQDPAEAPGQAGGRGGSARTSAAARASAADAAHAPAPGRDQAPGSAAAYPPQDAYGWQSPYETSAPEGSRSARRPPYNVQGRYPGQGRQGADPRSATRQYGSEAAYPQPAAPGAPAQTGGASKLAPLPGHAGDQQQVAETAEDLTAEALLHGKRQAPGGGWRRLLFKGSGGLIQPRESAEAIRRRELIARVRTPVAGGHHRVAVMSLKGGVGKTTTTVSLGAMLASLRGDRIIALDANPDRGTLSDKVHLETAATVRDLLNERDQIQRYADVRAFTSQAPSRLEVLASDRDPTVSVAFCEEDYYDAARVLEHFYSISLTDCGTGLLHSAMAGVLRMADQIILVSSPSVDGARSASATLDWLDAHNYGDLVRNAVVVLSMIRPRSKSTVDLDRLEHHFATRCRAVARIPYDAHLEEGAEVDLEQMSAATVNAYLVLAATVGDGFAWPRRAVREPTLEQGRDRRQAGKRSARHYRGAAPGGLA